MATLRVFLNSSRNFGNPSLERCGLAELLGSIGPSGAFSRRFRPLVPREFEPREKFRVFGSGRKRIHRPSPREVHEMPATTCGTDRSKRGHRPDLELLTAEDVGALLGCSAKNTLRMAKRGLLPAPVRFGRKIVRWPMQTIQNWIMNGCRATPQH